MSRGIKARIVASVVVTFMLSGVYKVCVLYLFPVRAMQVGVGQLEDSNQAFGEVQTFALGRYAVVSIIAAALILLLGMMWGSVISKWIQGDKV